MCLEKTDSNCRLPVDWGGGTPRPVLLTGVKKSGVRDSLRATACMGFQNFVVGNKLNSFHIHSSVQL